MILLVAIGGVSDSSNRALSIFATKRGQMASLILKLLFCYLLVGYSHTIDSPYHSIFLVPVVSAATTYGFAAVLAL